MAKQPNDVVVELLSDVESLQRIFWTRDRKIQELESRASTDKQLRERLEEEIGRLTAEVEKLEKNGLSSLKNVDERTTLMAQVLQLQEKAGTDRERYTVLHARCTELVERGQEQQDKLAEQSLEITELRTMRDMAEKKLAMDSLRNSKTIAELEERLAHLLSSSSEMEAAHNQKVEAMRLEFERQILQVTSTGQGTDAIQLYRLKLLAQEEKIHRLQEQLDQQTQQAAHPPPMPAASSSSSSSSSSARIAQPQPITVLRTLTPQQGLAAPVQRKPTPHPRAKTDFRSLERVAQIRQQKEPQRRSIASYGTLLQASSDEETDVLVPHRKEGEAKRMRRG